VTDQSPVGYGIDFGTSNSAVSIAYPDHVALVAVTGGEAALTLPSIIYLDREGRLIAGHEALREFLVAGHLKTDCWRCSLAPYGWDTDCRQYRKGGGCNDARLVSGVKHDLASPGFSGTNSWATDYTVAELAAVVLRSLKVAADSVCSADVRRVVLGHPVAFAGTDAEGPRHLEGCARLRHAAEKAGFEDVQLLPEPTAAVLGFRGGDAVAVAVDFGGGTCDVAVLDGRSGTSRVTALTGVSVGGDNVDAALFEVLVGPALGLDQLPNWLFNEMRTWRGAALLMADPGVPGILARLPSAPAAVAGAILLEGQAYDFYRCVEQAKIQLSRFDEVRLQYSRPPIDLDLPIRRSAFESLIRPELEMVRDAVDRALEQAEVRPDQVGRVLLTGGSSQIPAFRRDLAALFSEQRLEEADAFTAVVQGLGLRAREVWGGSITGGLRARTADRRRLM
jgi:hypothetical chaperone protein